MYPVSETSESFVRVPQDISVWYVVSSHDTIGGKMVRGSIVLELFNLIESYFIY